MKHRDIIIVGMQPWDIEIGSNCKNIALELAKENRVLYVNLPLDRGTIFRKKNDPKVQKRLNVLNDKEPDLVQIGNNLWNLNPRTILESINWIKPDPIFQIFNRVNNKRFASKIREASQKLGFRNVVLFNDNLILKAQYLKELLQPDLYIYYIRDFLAALDYFKKHALKAEKSVISAADIVVSNSDFLAEYTRQYNSNSFMVGQGCDFSQFDDTNGRIRVAPEIEQIGKPVIGYAGYITPLRIDENILLHIAESRPEWQLVLVGPENPSFHTSRLHQMSNVHFLGNKKPEDLASYIKGFDAAINPQLNNEITQGNYPRKIDEYLAMGKPVVATKTGFMNYFKEYTYLASSKEEYVSLIEKALQENSRERENARREFALLHTWENSVKEIYRQVENYYLRQPLSKSA